MKIVIFNHSFFNLSETFIYRQIVGLPRHIEAVLLSFQFLNEVHFPASNTKVSIKRNVNIIDRWATTAISFLAKMKLGFSLFNYFIVKKFLKRSAPDVIHAHFGFNAVTIFPLARLLNIPLIVSFHGVDASPQMLKNKVYENTVDEIIAYAKAVIIVSPHMIETLRLHKWKHKTHLIPYGVNPDEFITSTHVSNEEYITILHSGRLVSKKGVPDLIRVCIELTRKSYNIQLNILGDGPELLRCKELVEEAGCSNIKFLGAQPQDVVKIHMSRTDIFVLNSRTSGRGDMEGLPNAILEAMSTGLPVVSTYHAGIPQAITDGINGLLVKERDNEGLEEALAKLISSKTLRADLGRAARHTVENGFTIELMNDKIAAVYKLVEEGIAQPVNAASL